MIGSQQARQSLEPYSERQWTRREAAHLLWRTGFGATTQEIEQSTEAGLHSTLRRLLWPQHESAEFQSTELLLRQIAFDTRNISHLKAWWLYRMLNSANPLVEKLTLFWHNHFATSNAKVRSVEHMAAQNDLIRRHALGSFRELLHGMARDVAMLIWLDGNANRRRHANENFAREVMELFSLDVGNYTEQDITEAARALTGWHVRGGKFWFNQLQHDSGNKTVLGRSGNLDGNDVIDTCLAQPACPRFLAGKLLRSFVLAEPDAELVEQLARRIEAHDFVMAPVLGELFASRLFFSDQVRFALIKSPVELVLGSHRALESRANLQTTWRLLAELGQDVLQPPTVKGWEGGRLWINSATMLQRANFAAALLSSDRFGNVANPEDMAERFDFNSNQAVVDHYTELLLARDLDPDVTNRLVDYLRQAHGSRDERIRGMIQLIMTMPEYQQT